MKNPYEDYYLQQAGTGLPVFAGVRSQRGHGLLSGLARMVIPLLKQGGKTLLKEGVRTGAHILGDVMSGQNLQAAARQRVKQGGQRLLQQAAHSVLGADGTLPSASHHHHPAPPGMPATTTTTTTGIKRRMTKPASQSAKRRRAGRSTTGKQPASRQRGRDIFDN